MAIKGEVLCFFSRPYLNYDIEVNGVHYKLVHGAPTEEYENFRRFYPDPTYFSVWKRWRIFEEQHEDYTVIFGHTPTLDYQVCTPMQIWYGDRKIGIDCGSGYPEDPSEYYSKFGRLACLRLDDMQEFYSEERQVEEDA